MRRKLAELLKSKCRSTKGFAFKLYQKGTVTGITVTASETQHVTYHAESLPDNWEEYCSA